MNKFCLCFVLFCAATVFGLNHAAEFSCVPDQTYQDECNTCICSGDGKVAACTMMLCPVTAKIVEAEKQVCSPNESQMQDCNRCRCAMDGSGWLCTRRACPPAKGWEKRSVVTPLTKCQPGDSWKEDCNNCFCTGSGLPMCTRMACPRSFGNLRSKRDQVAPMRQVTMAEYDSPDFSCTPSEFFKLECNRCKCGPDGKTVTRCTKMNCPQEQ